MLNRVILIGRLTRDPELKYTGSGIAVANFTLAVDRKFQSAKGERETDFIRIVCWDKLAEHCKTHLGKGRLVAIDGRLQVRNYETPQGERRTIAEVRADDVRFLERAPAGSRGGDSSNEPGIDAYENDMPHPQPDMAKPAPARSKDYGKISDKEIDEEIDLTEDPF
jgi:single-strand DNA-binding protein